MKKKNTNPLFWFFIMFASIALIGFGFTPAVAQSDSGAFGDEETEGDFEALDEFEGEDLDAPEGDDSFGSSSQATWLAAPEFDPMDSGMTWNRGPFGTGSFRCRTAGGNFWFDANFGLPSGARLTIARLFYHDFSNVNAITLFLQRTTVSETNGVAATVTGFGSVSSPAGNSFWGNRAINLNTTIANRRNIYLARARIETGTCLIGVRLFWQRQIAPAGGQIFTDVPPSNNFYQQINNMARSGITTGCPKQPAPRYCPDDNVTRGQMAAFFARALGLHWAYGSGF